MVLERQRQCMLCTEFDNSDKYYIMITSTYSKFKIPG